MKKHLYRLAMPLFIWIVWLLLDDSLTPGSAVLGLIVSVVLVRAAAPLRPLRAFPKHPLTTLRLLCRVVGDMAVSGIAVARFVWLGRRAPPAPGFVDIPLTLRDPHGLAALACIVTYTPGTAWAGFREDDNVLTLHVLDLRDEAHWIDTIVQRYESPLKEIFE